MLLFQFQASWDAIAFIILFTLAISTVWKMLWLPDEAKVDWVIHIAIFLELCIFMIGILEGLKEFLIAQLLVALFWLFISLSDSLPKFK